MQGGLNALCHLAATLYQRNRIYPICKSHWIMAKFFGWNLLVADSWLGLKSFEGNGRNNGMSPTKWTGRNLSIWKLSLLLFCGGIGFFPLWFWPISSDKAQARIPAGSNQMTRICVATQRQRIIFPILSISLLYLDLPSLHTPSFFLAKSNPRFFFVSAVGVDWFRKVCFYSASLINWLDLIQSSILFSRCLFSGLRFSLE